MPQGGLDWEVIAIVAAAERGVIDRTSSHPRRRGSAETRKGLLMAWPVPSSRSWGCCSFTDFAAVLPRALITGLIWLFDAQGASAAHPIRPSPSWSTWRAPSSR
jgi:hypothetical protein